MHTDFTGNPCLEVHLLFDLNRQLLKWHTMDGPDRQIIYCLKCKKAVWKLVHDMRKLNNVPGSPGKQNHVLDR
ncbi:hypothetical protein AALO_G00089170 [Alosa alosa]|uniref:Uncharacterized protein n=1 Tax=Alosa alosa TaxID=278164 RepID=A0AAV6GZZ4_9TELE|nr:hypothetical protein AALO_G00089170 [Alosa alosa]